MKKTISIVLLGILVAGAFAAVPAQAKKKKKPHVRVVEGSYDQPAPGIGGVVTFSGQGGTIEIPTLAKENFIQIEVTDDVGTETYFGLAQEDTDGDGFGEIIYGGCTKTVEPLPITAGLLHTVTITTGPGLSDPTCPGIATSGTVKVTLTEKP